jgi:hypothetical protein
MKKFLFAAAVVLGLAGDVSAQCYSGGYTNYYPSYYRSYSSYSYPTYSYPTYTAPSYCAPAAAPVYQPVAAVTFNVPSPPTANIIYGGTGQYATPAAYVGQQGYVAPGAVNTYAQQAETRFTLQDIANAKAILTSGGVATLPGVGPVAMTQQRQQPSDGLSTEDIAALKVLAGQIRQEQQRQATAPPPPAAAPEKK